MPMYRLHADAYFEANDLPDAFTELAAHFLRQRVGENGMTLRGNSHISVMQESRFCTVCEDKGWLIAYNSSREITEIQRCDACELYASDAEAGAMAVEELQKAAKRLEL